MTTENTINEVNYLDEVIKAAEQRIIAAEQKRDEVEAKRRRLEAIHTQIEEKQVEIREIAVRRNTLSASIRRLQELGDKAEDFQKAVVAASMLMKELQIDISHLEIEITRINGKAVCNKYDEKVVSDTKRYLEGFVNTPRILKGGK